MKDLEKGKRRRAPIVKLVKEDPELTIAEISARLFLAHSTVMTYISEAKRAGELPRRRMRNSR